MIRQLRLHLPMQEVRVGSWVRELRSYLPRGQNNQNIKQKHYCNKFNKGIKTQSSSLPGSQWHVTQKWKLWVISCVILNSASLIPLTFHLRTPAPRKRMPTSLKRENRCKYTQDQSSLDSHPELTHQAWTLLTPQELEEQSLLKLALDYTVHHPVSFDTSL